MAKAFHRVIRAASTSHRGVVRSVSFKGFGAHTLRPPSRPCKPTRKRPGFLTQDRSLRPSCPQERLSGSKSLRGWVADQRSGPFPLHPRITTERSSGDSLGKGRGEQGRRFKWVPTGQPRLCSPSHHEGMGPCPMRREGVHFRAFLALGSSRWKTLRPEPLSSLPERVSTGSAPWCQNAVPACLAGTHLSGNPATLPGPSVPQGPHRLAGRWGLGWGRAGAGVDLPRKR